MKDIYVRSIARELGVKEWQVENCVKLFDEGATIPFVSRYRKEREHYANEKKKTAESPGTDAGIHPGLYQHVIIHCHYVFMVLMAFFTFI